MKQSERDALQGLIDEWMASDDESKKRCGFELQSRMLLMITEEILATGQVQS